MQIFGFLGSLLGYVLWGTFYILRDFGLSIIVFTLIVKICMFPFSLKQQKSMANMSRLSKKQKEIQEKYKNNRQLAQEEMNKLYEKEGVKPTGGCLTMLIPMLVIFGVFYAVAYPLTNTLHLDSANVNEAIAYVNTIPGYAMDVNPTYQQISFLNVFSNIENTQAIQNIFTAEQIQTINMFRSGFNTFGINLFSIPQEYGFFNPMILFPVLCFASNVGSQLIMTKINKNQMQQQGCMKLMIYVLPLFSAYIAYVVPAAVAFYWIISSVISLIQSIILGKLFSTEQMVAKSEARHAALLLQEEAKVEYAYVPQDEVYVKNDNSNNKRKKKKKKK